MTFQKIPAPFASQSAWGTCDGERSYMIIFDADHPALGYTASWRGVGRPTEYLLESFETLGQAKRALAAVQKARSH